MIGIGGKWNRAAKAHVFESDPLELLGRVKDGEKVNLKKEFQFFETPPELADRIVEIAFKDVAHFPIGQILEPSAGRGAIVDAIFRKFSYADVVVCELMGTNSNILMEKYGMKISMIPTPNFLDHKRPNHYTYIVANPPFTKNQDIDHIYHMYDCLEPQGIMVSIASQHSFISNNKKEMEFQRWLRAIGANITEIEKGAFAESGTMVGAYIIAIEKS